MIHVKDLLYITQIIRKKIFNCYNKNLLAGHFKVEKILYL